MQRKDGSESEPSQLLLTTNVLWIKNENDKLTASVHGKLVVPLQQ